MTDFQSLLKNGSFCVLPWIHYHSHPTGETRVCCVADSAQTEGEYRNAKDSSIPEIMNSSAHKLIRSQMLRGEKPLTCHRCYEHESEGRESYTFRHSNNQLYNRPDIADIIANTDEDGTLNRIELKYIDVRFSNICNLRCRTCHHDLSSSWYDEHVALTGAPVKKFITTENFDALEEYLQTVDRIYFAGGEPLLTPDHYRILDWLIQKGRTDVHLIYNSNLSNLSYKGKSILEYWKHFKYLYVAASIDGMDQHVEYIRTNIKWDRFRNNLNELKRAGIPAWPSITASILNIEHLVDFWRFCMEEGWASKEVPLGINFVDYPDYFSIRNLTDSYKSLLTTKFENLKDWLNTNGFAIQTKGIDTILSYMNKPGDPEKLKECLGWLNKYDETANLNWKSSLPELAVFFNKLDLR